MSYVVFVFMFVYAIVSFYTLCVDPLTWEENGRLFAISAVIILQVGHFGVHEIYKS